jgi:hypothetical protein
MEGYLPALPDALLKIPPSGRERTRIERRDFADDERN